MARDIKPADLKKRLDAREPVEQENLER